MTSITSASTPRKPRNLKMSCDFCALSKLKCDRNRPQCQRCDQNELKCRYSRSRRVSKARQSYTDPGQAGYSGENNPPPTSQRNQQSSNESSSEGPPAIRTLQGPGESLPGISGLGDFMDLRDVNRMDMTSDTMFPFTEAFTNSSYTMQQGVSPDFIGSVVRTFECPQGGSRNLPLSPDMNVANIISSLALEPWDLAENDLGLSQTTLDKDQCIKRACAILESLCVPVLGCPRQARDSHSPMSNSYGVGIILKTNQTAVDSALAILPCSCTSDPGILNILILIGKQIMDSYWKLFQQQFPSSLDETGEGLETSISNVPITIDGYILEKEVSKQVLLQVLRLEVNKMARFTEILLPGNVLRQEVGSLKQSVQAYQGRLMKFIQNQV